jgi:apolipoprotein N-acyltransferase
VLLRCVLALVGGGVLSLAFEPVGAAALMPLSVATLVLAVRGVRARLAWLPGLLFGIGF